MNHKAKVIELLGEKKEVIWDCNCRGLGCKHCYSQGSNQMHSKAVEVVVGLLERIDKVEKINEELRIDYAWEKKDAIPCACGSKKCKGIIIDARGEK